MNPEDDVIDRIDELVTESLTKPWDQISGYDNDINQESCGHCGRAWHGLPQGVCPGATFIGPRRPTALEQYTIDGAPWQIPDLADVFDPEPWRVLGASFQRGSGGDQRVDRPDPTADQQMVSRRQLPRRSGRTTDPAAACPATPVADTTNVGTAAKP